MSVAAGGRVRFRAPRQSGRCSTATRPIEGETVGRPRATVDAAQVATLRAAGSSWRVISEQLGIGVGTACRALQPFPKTSRNLPSQVLDSEPSKSVDPALQKQVFLRGRGRTGGGHEAASEAPWRLAGQSLEKSTPLMYCARLWVLEWVSTSPYSQTRSYYA
jgi:transposase